jgi:hypothetical protein
LLDPAGSAWFVHVAPPLVVARTSVGVFALRVARAKQSLTDGQEMLSIPVTPVGTFWLDQDSPPFVVATITPKGVPAPDPTAMQLTVEEHSTPLSAATPLGRV